MELTTEIIEKIQEAMKHTKKNGDVIGKMVMRSMSVWQGHSLQIGLLLYITEQRVAPLNTTLSNDNFLFHTITIR